MRPYVIRQGDHLLGLAARFNFDADEVWNSDDNRNLREHRATPNVLLPGDILYIPEPEPEPRATIESHTTNRYTARSVGVPIRVVLRHGGEVLANEACVVTSLTPSFATQTDGEGLLELEVPHHLDVVRVRVPARHLELALRVGHLNPISEPSGVRARLENLGFLLPQRRLGADRSSAHNEDAERIRLSRALAFFQLSRELEPTGNLDDETRDALLAAHGDDGS